MARVISLCGLAVCLTIVVCCVSSLRVRPPVSVCLRKRLACRQFCPNGFVKGPDGCPTCTCKPGPLDCGPICRMHCPHGFRKDRRGCPICTCNPGPVCPKLSCGRKSCPRGFQTNSRGCPTCQCKPHSCPLVNCAIYCPNGFKKNSRGCQTCTCKERSVCPLIKCSRPCPHGTRKNARGCQTCICKAKCPSFLCTRTCWNPRRRPLLPTTCGCPRCRRDRAGTASLP
ncbi:hypothetical protein ACOMHN_026238 [Nucella lapillus]